MTIEFFNHKEDEEELEIKKMFKEMGFPNLGEKEPEIKLEPKLEPQFINYGMIEDYTPEKIEFWDGILYLGEPWI